MRERGREVVGQCETGIYLRPAWGNSSVKWLRSRIRYMSATQCLTVAGSELVQNSVLDTVFPAIGNWSTSVFVRWALNENNLTEVLVLVIVVVVLIVSL